MRLPRAAILMPMALSATHAIDLIERRVRSLQKSKGKDDQKDWEPFFEHDKLPPPPVQPPSYPPAAGPPTLSPVGKPVYNDDYAYDDDRGGKGKGGKGKGKGLQPPDTDDYAYDDTVGGKGKGKGLLPPDTDDYAYYDDRGGKGKGKGLQPPDTDDYAYDDDRSGKGKGSSSGKGKSKGRKSKGSKLPKKKDVKNSSKSQKAKMSKVTSGPTSKGLSKGKGKGSFTSMPTQHKPPPPKAPTVPTSPPSRPPSSGPCNSPFSNFVLENVPEAIVKNPIRCCDFDGSTAAIVTHAQPDNSTISGFEPFWNNMYEIIDKASQKAKVCFFMTGYQPNVVTGRNLSEVLISVNQAVSSIPKVPSIMSTDPTDSAALISEIRAISLNPSLSSIGIFNSGYSNTQLESLVSGLPPLPFVGYMDDEAYGREAAQATRELLGSERPTPLCFNARVNMVPLVGKRCEAYYSALEVEVQPDTGISCDSSTTSQQVFEILLSNNINAVWSHIDCCLAVAQASQSASQMGRNIVVGCQDDTIKDDVTVNFVTRQPETLQGYATSTWVNFPVIQELRGRDGRAEQYFPSLSSLVNTAIYNTIFE